VKCELLRPIRQGTRSVITNSRQWLGEKIEQ